MSPECRAVPARRALVAAVTCAATASALAVATAGGSETARTARIPAPTENPCVAEVGARMRCPDLVMRRPFDVSVDTITRRGRVLLRAGNSIDNVGDGPAELRGERSGPAHMRAIQRIHPRRGRGLFRFRTGARLYFKFIPGQRRYWKFANAAGFELWRLDSSGRRVRRVRRGPKQSYCLRDLVRTRPRLRRSPRRFVYPGCNTSSATRRVTLGTSVGWSDVYPATYHEQWIDVTGVRRGCFAYDEIADPRNGIWEKREDNNRATAVVRLPYRPGRQRCPRLREAAPAGGGDGGGGAADPYA
jgi:hypothetical protein